MGWITNPVPYNTSPRLRAGALMFNAWTGLLQITPVEVIYHAPFKKRFNQIHQSILEKIAKRVAGSLLNIVHCAQYTLQL